MKKEQPSYYAIIPANVRYDKHIPAGAKLLYGEVTALSNQKGYCFASNGYFSELYGCTPQAISKWFKRLEAAGYVRISYHGEPGNQERRVSISVESYQPQLRGVSTVVEGVSTTVEHNNTSIIIQEGMRENAPANLDFFSPDKHEQTAAHIIAYLEENPMYLNGMANGNWKRAVKGHCLKLQKAGSWNELQIPKDEGMYFSWVGKRIAGAKSWFATAAEIDRKSGRQDQQPAVIKAPAPDQASQPIRRATPEQARKIAGI